MKRIGLVILASVICVMMLSSCVSTKKYKTLEGKYAKCQADSLSLDNQNKQLNATVADKIKQIDAMQKQIEALINDTTNLGYANRNLRNSLAKQSDEYGKLLALSQNNTKAAKDELKNLYNELQAYKEQLRLKDEAMAKLRQTLEAALLGFKDKGLAVEIRDGKVYVTLQESLLFKSGRWTVNEEGQKAIKEIANVLSTNKDIDVLVEGHTDNVPFNGNGNVKDNWDLSVMRATSIVNHILENKNVSGGRLTSAGRADFNPVATNDTAEGRAKNRRTDIILSPRLDIIYELIKE